MGRHGRPGSCWRPSPRGSSRRGCRFPVLPAAPAVGVAALPWTGPLLLAALADFFVDAKWGDPGAAGIAALPGLVGVVAKAAARTSHIPSQSVPSRAGTHAKASLQMVQPSGSIRRQSTGSFVTLPPRQMPHWPNRGAFGDPSALLGGGATGTGWDARVSTKLALASLLFLLLALLLFLCQRLVKPRLSEKRASTAAPRNANSTSARCGAQTLRQRIKS